MCARLELIATPLLLALLDDAATPVMPDDGSDGGVAQLLLLSLTSPRRVSSEVIIDRRPGDCGDCAAPPCAALAAAGALRPPHAVHMLVPSIVVAADAEQSLADEAPPFTVNDDADDNAKRASRASCSARHFPVLGVALGWPRTTLQPRASAHRSS